MTNKKEFSPEEISKFEENRKAVESTARNIERKSEGRIGWKEFQHDRASNEDTMRKYEAYKDLSIRSQSKDGLPYISGVLKGKAIEAGGERGKVEVIIDGRVIESKKTAEDLYEKLKEKISAYQSAAKSERAFLKEDEEHLNTGGLIEEILS